ncbi:MAG: hypothetical protein ABI406_21085 [Ktedonobacteraceae bacterium]
MSSYELAHLITAPRPLRQLIIPPIEEQEGREALLKHGCRIEDHPPGKLTGTEMNRSRYQRMRLNNVNALKKPRHSTSEGSWHLYFSALNK